MARTIRWSAWALAAAVLAAPPVFAGGPAVAFDKAGSGVGEIVRQAKETVKQDKTGVQGVQAAFTRAERDCARFNFEPNGPNVSEAVWLRSTEYIEECRNIPGHPDHGGGTRDCWERPGWTYRKKAQVEISNRQPVLPWERESFSVCLEGSWLDFDVVAAAYEYKVRGNNDGYYVLTPGKKIPMNPDSNGIIAGIPFNTGGGMALEFTDRWAAYYGEGEQTVISLTLFKDVANWFDTKVGEAELVYKPAPSYRVDFAALNAKLEPGRKYYAKWGFKRIGRVSKGTFMKRGETEKTTYKPAPGLPAAAR